MVLEARRWMAGLEARIRSVMSLPGLVPGEQSSGSRHRKGGFTRSGNGHVRGFLVESAWSNRYPARKTAHLRRVIIGATPSAAARARNRSHPKEVNIAVVTLN